GCPGPSRPPGSCRSTWCRGGSGATRPSPGRARSGGARSRLGSPWSECAAAATGVAGPKVPALRRSTPARRGGEVVRQAWSARWRCTMDVLVSGASVAGPVTAYWLRRYGFRVTVVERAPALRKAGGHAVDLFTPAMGIVERMGLLDQVMDRRTGTERMTVLREGARRPVTIELTKLMGG